MNLVEAEDDKSDSNSNSQITDIHARIGDHRDKAKILVIAKGKADEIINHPAGYNSVECHQAYVSCEGKISVDLPLLTWLFQFLIHADRAGL